MATMEEAMQAQSQDIVGIIAGFARPDDRVFIQNTRTAAVHYARSNDSGHTVCGWKLPGAGRRGPGLVYCIVNCLTGPPGGMLCERCLPNERAIAINIMDELSGDE